MQPGIVDRLPIKRARFAEAGRLNRRLEKNTRAAHQGRGGPARQKGEDARPGPMVRGAAVFGVSTRGQTCKSLKSFNLCLKIQNTLTTPRQMPHQRTGDQDGYQRGIDIRDTGEQHGAVALCPGGGPSQIAVSGDQRRLAVAV